MSWNERPSWFVWRAELSSGGLRFVLRFLRRRPQRIPRSEGRSELELIAGVIRIVLRAGLRATASLTSAPEARGPIHASHRAGCELPNALPGRSSGGRFHARQRAHAVRTPCARCSVGVDRGGGQSLTPGAYAPIPDRGLGPAIGPHRGRVWRAKSPSADPCLATQLRAEGPGSSNAEGVPTKLWYFYLFTM